MKKQEIRARLVVNSHEEMTDSEFKFFRKWIKSVAEEMQVQKRGSLSKKYKATLFKTL